MGANGDQDPPLLQRVFWALIEGATATALLVAGGTDSLTALQVSSPGNRGCIDFSRISTFYFLGFERS